MNQPAYRLQLLQHCGGGKPVRHFAYSTTESALISYANWMLRIDEPGGRTVCNTDEIESIYVTPSLAKSIKLAGGMLVCDQRHDGDLGPLTGTGEFNSSTEIWYKNNEQEHNVSDPVSVHQHTHEEFEMSTNHTNAANTNHADAAAEGSIVDVPMGLLARARDALTSPTAKSIGLIVLGAIGGAVGAATVIEAKSRRAETNGTGALDEACPAEVIIANDQA